MWSVHVLEHSNGEKEFMILPYKYYTATILILQSTLRYDSRPAAMSAFQLALALSMQYTSTDSNGRIRCSTVGSSRPQHVYLSNAVHPRQSTRNKDSVRYIIPVYRSPATLNRNGIQEIRSPLLIACNRLKTALGVFKNTQV